MSRTRARKTLTAASLSKAMEGRTWLGNKAARLVDEHPEAYKDIEEVMRLSADLVTVKQRLRAILNYKGT
jgi:tRNA-splicing ligase RtcB